MTFAKGFFYSVRKFTLEVLNFQRHNRLRPLIPSARRDEFVHIRATTSLSVRNYNEFCRKRREGKSIEQIKKETQILAHKKTIRPKAWLNLNSPVQVMKDIYVPTERFRRKFNKEGRLINFGRRTNQFLPFNIKGTRSGRLLGIHPIGPTYRPQIIKRAPNWSISFAYNNPSFCGKYDYVTLGNTYTVGGSWETNRTQVAGFFDNRRYTMKVHDYLKIFEKVIDTLPHYAFDMPSRSDMLVMPINPKSGPANDFAIHYKNKKDAIFTAVPCAFQLWDLVSTGLVFRNQKKDKSIIPVFNREGIRLRFDNFVANMGEFTVGGKSKNSTYEYGDLFTSRAVVNSCFVYSLIARPFTYLIEKAWKRSEYSPIYYGHNSGHGGWVRDVSDYIGALYVITGDFKMYDSSLKAEVIALAFGIIRSWFPLGEEVDRFFFFFSSEFLSKHIITPDGLYYHSYAGMPSGSPFTTIINSICNFIILSSMVETCPAFDNCRTNYKLNVMGDDFRIIIYAGTISMTSGDIMVDWCDKNLGMDLVDLTIYDNWYSYDEKKCPEFLKTIFIMNSHGINPATSSDVIRKRTLCPKNKIWNNPYDHADKTVRPQLVYAGMNTTASEFLYRFIAHLTGGLNTTDDRKFKGYIYEGYLADQDELSYDFYNTSKTLREMSSPYDKQYGDRIFVSDFTLPGEEELYDQVFAVGWYREHYKDQSIKYLTGKEFINYNKVYESFLTKLHGNVNDVSHHIAAVKSCDRVYFDEFLKFYSKPRTLFKTFSGRAPPWYEVVLTDEQKISILVGNVIESLKIRVKDYKGFNL